MGIEYGMLSVSVRSMDNNHILLTRMGRIHYNKIAVMYSTHLCWKCTFLNQHYFLLVYLFLY